MVCGAFRASHLILPVAQKENASGMVGSHGLPASSNAKTSIALFWVFLKWFAVLVKTSLGLIMVLSLLSVK